MTASYGDRHQFHPTLLREYDIRGIMGETLFAADAYHLGRAFATRMRKTGGDSICVGRTAGCPAPSSVRP